MSLLHCYGTRIFAFIYMNMFLYVWNKLLFNVVALKLERQKFSKYFINHKLLPFFMIYVR